MGSRIQIALEVAAVAKCSAAVGVGAIGGSAGGVGLPGDLRGSRDIGACCLIISILLGLRRDSQTTGWSSEVMFPHGGCAIQTQVNERRNVGSESVGNLLLADPMEKTGDSHFSPFRASSLYSVALELIPPGSLMSLKMLSSWVMA